MGFFELDNLNFDDKLISEKQNILSLFRIMAHNGNDYNRSLPKLRFNYARVTYRLMETQDMARYIFQLGSPRRCFGVKKPTRYTDCESIIPTTS